MLMSMATQTSAEKATQAFEAVIVANDHPYSIVAIFVVGYLIHALMQVDAIARSNTNPVESRSMIIRENSIRLLARFFVSLMAFLYVWHNPATIPTVLGYIPGVSLSDNVVSLMTLPMSPPVSGILGFFFDSLLAYVPVLKNALPPIEFTEKEQTVITKVTKETRTVSTAPIDAPIGTAHSSVTEQSSSIHKEEGGN